MNPLVTVKRTSNAPKMMAAVKSLQRKRVLVGIPASDAANRTRQLLKMAAAEPGIVAKANLMRAAKDITNAEKLWIFSKGSPLRGQPARPVIEPAIVAPGNKEAITAELAAAAKATINGNEEAAAMHLKRAGIAGQRAAVAWFTDPRNNWAANAPSTIHAKGSDVPGIDTAAMKQAIVYLVEE